MKNKLIFMLSIFLGLITALLINSYLSNIRKTIDNVEYVKIVVAKQDIPANTLITESLVAIKTIPQKYKHEKEIADISKVIGKISLISINNGESILSNQIIKAGEQIEGLAYMIPAGKRAMSVAVDVISGINGNIKVSDKVDVITTIQIGENPPTPYSLVVLQNIEVLAVGKAVDVDTKEDNKKEEESKTVTLSVSLEESLKLKMASQRGEISLLLRSPIDKSTSNPIPFKADDFLK